MPTVENLLLFVPTITLLILVPGPDFAIVSKVSLLEGRARGQIAALGVALGVCLHTLLAMLGISAILLRSHTLFACLQYGGAAWLVFLGVRAIRRGFGHGCAECPASGLRKNDIRPMGESPGDKPLQGGRLAALRAGFFTNALNPKAVLFFMVLLPQFLEPTRSIWTQFFVLGGISAIICLAWFVSLAAILGKVGPLFASRAFEKWLERVTGGIFILFGIRLATQEW